MSLVSVIIPNYNHAFYLKERIDSVLNQNYQNIEIIILDDYSTDNSKEIIECYRTNSKIKHIEYNKKNSGSTFKQWEKGIKIAKGEWIWIAESDDVADKQFLSKLLEKQEEEDVGLIYCNSLIIDKNSNNSEFHGYRNMPSKEKFSEFSKDFVMGTNLFLNNWMVKYNFIPNASAVLFRKSILPNDVFKKISNLKLLGDWVFWIILLNRIEKIYYSSETLNRFRNHSNNVRSNNVSNGISEYSYLISFIDPKFRKTALDSFAYKLANKKKEARFNLNEKIKILLFLLKNSILFIYVKSFLKKVLISINIFK